MKKKTTKKESGEATRANVKKEMAKPRMAQSARDATLKAIRRRIAPAKRAKAKLLGPGILHRFLATKPVSSETSKAETVVKFGDHSSIWDSWPIALSGYPRGLGSQ